MIWHNVASKNDYTFKSIPDGHQRGFFLFLLLIIESTLKS